ncbi:methyl-accepting chemotaxis protein [Nitrogeniibacter mangrovi]|uniref:Methyl-accepting chemotaxis protein n=1 Tax=Nitrogeniibacter mangrovi TaxID=2016596 RepID=A0A6C1B4X5_9RHOO|nr:PAS domain-containing methyl-accepting chemotaxis protein [Nitrogeniibacter mangrovi]QID18741.1 methyl-accepting chemotaxis protein [Nitrogeniibacter mangrovi]
MKNNQPVTNVEHFLQPGQPIVTRTDLKGCITYVNPAFIEISGFSSQELLGANHNIVRHPDMPVEAFADLWRTVKSGHTWRGLVKNRAKDGGFYWVDAFVTPETRDGRTVGYMSVRNAPARNDVAAAETLYANVRDRRAPLPATWTPPPLARGLVAVRVPITAAALLAVAGAMLSGPWAMAAGAGAALCSLAALATFETRLARPLHLVSAHIEALDEGRLDRRISRQDGGAIASVFGQLEAMRVHLRAMFADVLTATGSVHMQSAALENETQALRQSSETQGEEVMQAAAAMEQMSVSVNEISSNTEVGAQAARDTAQAVDDARQAILEGVNSSAQAAQVVATARDQIAAVHTSVQKIGEISQIIEDIAEQTNLLALNAAIEAARAGEQGRGFAVVADEVRKLAERTTASTADISRSLAQITEQSKAAVTTMDKAARDVAASSDQVGSSAGSLDLISAASQRASGVATDIRTMLEQQTTASHEVATAMEAISSNVERNNASLSQIDRAAADLNRTAADLRALIQHLENALK